VDFSFNHRDAMKKLDGAVADKWRKLASFDQATNVRKIAPMNVGMAV
jgi:hypothetical protein